MFQLLTTDEFAEWFGALDEDAAEEVATALEIIERVGASEEAPGSTEWVLWYQHSAARHSLAIDDFLSFRASMLQWLRHLESSRFGARLARLSPANGAVVLGAIDALRSAAGLRRASLLANVRRLLPTPSALAEVRQLYVEALRAAGFEWGDFPAHSTALRELALRSTSPPMRVLYGVDTASDRALVLLGERLDRRFFGDSVRRAETMWRSFLQGELGAREASLRADGGPSR